jgi:hypothetical protein
MKLQFPENTTFIVEVATCKTLFSKDDNITSPAKTEISSRKLLDCCWRPDFSGSAVIFEHYINKIS